MPRDQQSTRYRHALTPESDDSLASRPSPAKKRAKKREAKPDASVDDVPKKARARNWSRKKE
nr:uncharacterized protein I303_01862 [Kwoniella dejecticola CBS 10117]OBR87654.1 hypothetical protein I303_01862 [Kwoniella dejecticola CBS 10117]